MTHPDMILDPSLPMPRFREPHGMTILTEIVTKPRARIGGRMIHAAQSRAMKPLPEIQREIISHGVQIAELVVELEEVSARFNVLPPWLKHAAIHAHAMAILHQHPLSAETHHAHEPRPAAAGVAAVATVQVTINVSDAAERRALRAMIDALELAVDVPVDAPGT